MQHDSICYNLFLIGLKKEEHKTNNNNNNNINKNEIWNCSHSIHGVCNCMCFCFGEGEMWYCCRWLWSSIVGSGKYTVGTLLPTTVSTQVIKNLEIREYILNIEQMTNYGDSYQIVSLANSELSFHIKATALFTVVALSIGTLRRS